jgi:hypothetical protein
MFLNRGGLMKNIVLDPPTFAFVLGTRAALAAGIGLLVADKLSATRRRAIGATLVAVGAATTIPAAISVMRSIRRSKLSGVESSVDRDERMIGATRFPRKGDDENV